MSDLFDMLSGQGRRQRGPRKSEDTTQRLPIPLKHFYLGTTKCVSILALLSSLCTLLWMCTSGPCSP
jgi:DnaJ-class molecular chaperone